MMSEVFVPAVGLFVELHSLTRADLNGIGGECVTYDSATARWGVMLLATRKKMAVRPTNLRRMSLPSNADVALAQKASHSAMLLLQQARAGRTYMGQNSESAAGSTPWTNHPLIAQAEVLLAEAEEHYPAYHMMHQVRGDIAHMRDDMLTAVRHYRRTVSNGTVCAPASFGIKPSWIIHARMVRLLT
jgi:hypothetical protein